MPRVRMSSAAPLHGAACRDAARCSSPRGGSPPGRMRAGHGAGTPCPAAPRGLSSGPPAEGSHGTARSTQGSASRRRPPGAEGTAAALHLRRRAWDGSGDGRAAPSARGVVGRCGRPADPDARDRHPGPLSRQRSGSRMTRRPSGGGAGPTQDTRRGACCAECRGAWAGRPCHARRDARERPVATRQGRRVPAGAPNGKGR